MPGQIQTNVSEHNEHLAGFPSLFDSVIRNVETVIRGKHSAVRLAVTCLFAGGHLLIEDVPGVGKTVLSKSLAHSIGGRFGRVQFTPDLLPSDVLGTSVWNQSSGEFVFHPGPVFSNVLLADEINRASPKTQSALLEAMAESQVTVDGSTIDLGQPFMVIATQNPLEHHGTYPLPESQLDRFLMKLSMGYPDHAAEMDLLLNSRAENDASSLRPIVDPRSVSDIGSALDSIYTSEPVADYLIQLARSSRTSSRFLLGISPRALLGLLRASKVLAASQGRTFVSPDDIKELAIPVLAHRVIPVSSRERSASTDDAIHELIGTTPVPT